LTLDVYADLFDDDLDAVAANLDAAIRFRVLTASRRHSPSLRISSSLKGTAKVSVQNDVRVER
jgi:hypothetical protein